MQVSINNQELTIAADSTLQSLVNARLGDKQKGVAVAVNDTVIPKSAWESHLIHTNDHILIIKATQGG